MSDEDYGRLALVGSSVKPTRTSAYIGIAPTVTTRNSMDSSDVKILYITSTEEYNQCVRQHVHDKCLREIFYTHDIASSRIQFQFLKSMYDNKSIDAFREVLQKCIMIGMHEDDIELEYSLSGNDKHYFLTMITGWANRPTVNRLEKEIAFRWHKPFQIMPRVIVPNTGDVKLLWTSKDWVTSILLSRGSCECMFTGDMTLLHSIPANEVKMNMAIHHHLYEKQARSEPAMSNYVGDKFAFILAGVDRNAFNNVSIASKIVLAIMEDLKCQLSVAISTYQRTLVNIGASMCDELSGRLRKELRNYKMDDGIPYNIHTLLYLMRYYSPRMYLWFMRIKIDQLVHTLGRSKSDDILALKSLIFHSNYSYYSEKKILYRVTPYGAPQKSGNERGNVQVCNNDTDIIELDNQIRHICNETSKTARGSRPIEMIPLPTGDTRNYTCVQDGVIEYGVHRMYLCGDYVERSMGFHVNSPRDIDAIERCKSYYRHLFGDVVGEFMLYMMCTRIYGTPCKRFLHLKGATGAGKTYYLQRLSEVFGGY